MIDSSRIHTLNEDPPAPKGEYVLYWMQASQRAECNHALEHAIEQANAADLPVVVCFGLMDDYPEANLRHYAFMLEGLRQTQETLRRRGVLMVIRRGPPAEVALHYAKRAAMVVCDRGYLRHQKAWRDAVADRAKRRVVQVESDVVVPVEEVSDKAEFAARTIRPKIRKRLTEFLREPSKARMKRKSTALAVEGNIDLSDLEKAIDALKVDRNVARSKRFQGGSAAGRKVLKRFIATRLADYAEGRNEPSAAGTSTMAAYLHFGQLSPLEVALAVKNADAPQVDRDAYLEELIVRRELGINFCHYAPRYDEYDGLPEWARKSLAEHRNDRRPHVYSLAQLERAETYDPYWNAAQREMTKTGFMHNYMRMYWGKKVLEWKKTPQEAYADLLHLNNKYFLCGRDPLSYSNVAWIFGLHDRPWGPERPIFGKVRYMNAAGLERKFDMDAYVKWVESL